MKVLIIGKHGQVGRSLQVCARKQNIDYIAIGRKECDISDEKAVEKYFVNHHDYDFVINAAAYTAVDKAEKEIKLADSVNHLAVGYLADSCKNFDIPLFHISTDYVFNGEKETLYHEEDNTSPTSVYGESKLAGEKRLINQWHKHIILRVSWVFSPYGNNFVKTIAKLAKEKSTMNIVADQYGAPTSAYSIAEAALAVCEQQHNNDDADDKWGVYHYSDFPLTTWHQFAVSIKKIMASNVNLNPIKSSEYPMVATRPKNSGLDIRKISRIFGVSQALWQKQLNWVKDDE